MFPWIWNFDTKYYWLSKGFEIINGVFHLLIFFFFQNPHCCLAPYFSSLLSCDLQRLLNLTFHPEFYQLTLSRIASVAPLLCMQFCSVSVTFEAAVKVTFRFLCLIFIVTTVIVCLLACPMPWGIFQHWQWSLARVALNTFYLYLFLSLLEPGENSWHEEKNCFIFFLFNMMWTLVCGIGRPGV